jgi:hypothetical protein
MNNATITALVIEQRVQSSLKSDWQKGREIMYWLTVLGCAAIIAPLALGAAGVAFLPLGFMAGAGVFTGFAFTGWGACNLMESISWRKWCSTSANLISNTKPYTLSAAKRIAHQAAHSKEKMYLSEGATARIQNSNSDVQAIFIAANLYKSPKSRE